MTSPPKTSWLLAASQGAGKWLAGLVAAGIASLAGVWYQDHLTQERMAAAQAETSQQGVDLSPNTPAREAPSRAPAVIAPIDPLDQPTLAVDIAPPLPQADPGTVASPPAPLEQPSHDAETDLGALAAEIPIPAPETTSQPSPTFQEGSVSGQDGGHTEICGVTYRLAVQAPLDRVVLDPVETGRGVVLKRGSRETLHDGCDASLERIRVPLRGAARVEINWKDSSS